MSWSLDFGIPLTGADSNVPGWETFDLIPLTRIQEAGAVLNPVPWPDDEVERALFGDRQVTQIAQLHVVDSRESLDDLRQYKNNTKVIGQALAVLKQRALLS